MDSFFSLLYRYLLCDSYGLYGVCDQHAVMWEERCKPFWSRCVVRVNCYVLCCDCCNSSVWTFLITQAPSYWSWCYVWSHKHHHTDHIVTCDHTPHHNTDHSVTCAPSAAGWCEKSIQLSHKYLSDKNPSTLRALIVNPSRHGNLEVFPNKLIQWLINSWL